jgi:hypothetical protein
MTLAANQCNRDDWIAGVWILSIGLTVLISSIFGLVQGHKLYAFASEGEDEARLQDI